MTATLCRVRDFGATGEWVDAHDNLAICGKSWLACALGHKACRDDRSVLYQRVPRLFANLVLARGDGRYARLQRTLGNVQLLILLCDRGVGRRDRRGHGAKRGDGVLASRLSGIDREASLHRCVPDCDAVAAGRWGDGEGYGNSRTVRWHGLGVVARHLAWLNPYTDFNDGTCVGLAVDSELAFEGGNHLCTSG